MTDLDAAIRKRLALDEDSTYFCYDSEMIQGAVFAVLDLHRPIWDGERCAECTTSVPDCGTEPAYWPRATVEVIAKGLGIEI